MNVKEMTNEELAVYFFNAAEGGTTLFKRCLREAATRLRDLKPCSKNFKCDSLEELLTDEKRKTADLHRRMKVAEDALVITHDRMTTATLHEGLSPTEHIYFVRRIASKALAAIREEEGEVK